MTTGAREPSPRAKARQDLIVRLFPVSISVGFATRLIDMDWVKTPAWPSYAEWEQLARVATAIFVIVSGWEWYHRDVRLRPLERPYRFIIDVLVVILGMIFLYSSSHPAVWFLSLIAIFACYVLWDLLSMAEYPGEVPSRRLMADVKWLFYFCLLAAASWWWFENAHFQAFVASFFILLGAIALRYDGEYEDVKGRKVIGWQWAPRLMAVITLLVAYVAVSALLLLF